MTTNINEKPELNSFSDTELANSELKISEEDQAKSSPISLYSCSSLSSHSSESSRCSLASSHTSSSSTIYSNYSCSRKERLEISFYETEHTEEKFVGRTWLFNKILQWLNHKSSIVSNKNFDVSSNGVMIVGGPGCGKSFLIDEITRDKRSPDIINNPADKLSSRVLAYFKCDKNVDEKSNLPRFILSIRDQILNSNLPIASFYKNFLVRNNKIVLPYFTSSRLCVAPDDVFRKGILDILQEYSTDDGTQSFVIVIDSLDESLNVHSGFSYCFRDDTSFCESSSTFHDFASYQNKSLDSNLSSESPRNFNYSRSIAELISNNINQIPKWLSFIATCNRVNRNKMGKLFPKFQRLTLDDLRRPSVLQDVQHYMLRQIENEKVLQSKFRSQEGIAALQQINIKSNGCILFVKIVLHGSKQGWINLKDIASIPGTLNGLYLWLCDYLFPTDSKVIIISEIKTIIEILLASKKRISLTDLYQTLKLHDKNYTKKILESNLHAMSRILDKDGEYIKFFHDSFADWIKDLKHCTENYYCDESRGHELLANYMIDRFRLYPFKSVKEVYRLVEHCIKAKNRLKINLKEIANLIKFSKVDLKYKSPKLYFWNLDLETENLLLTFGHDPIFFNTLKMYKEEIDRETDVREMHEKQASTSISNLCNAVYQGELTHVKNILASGVIDINLCNSNGSTALNLAARRDRTDIIKLLLQAGADINQIDTEGWSPLRSAAWSGSFEIVKLLLENGAKVDLTSPDQRTALRAASWAGHDKIVELLIQHNADIGKCDAEGRTPLIAAAYMGNSNVLKILVENNAYLNHADNDGRTALNVAAVCVAASEEHRKIVEILLRSKANPDIPDNEGITPLLGATYNYKDRLDICRTLIEFGADVDKKDKLGFTPLLIACSQGCLDLVRLFLQWDASINIYDAAGRSALTLAAIGGFTDIMQELLNRGLDVDHKDNTGSSPLHYAAANGYLNCLRLLVENGSQIDIVDHANQTALLLATQYNKTFCALYLICPELTVPKYLCNPQAVSNGVGDEKTRDKPFPDYNSLLKASRKSINIPSIEGMTPLRSAVLNKNLTLVEVLQLYRADPNLQDSYGRTILYLLALEGDIKLTQRLLYAQSFVPNEYKNSIILANPGLADDEGRCPLHVAAWQGHLELAKNLIMSGVPIDIRDKEGRTPLQSAAWQGDAPMCQLLLSLGAQVDAICKQSATALCISAQENHIEVCKVLLLAGADPYQTDAFGRSAIKVAKKAGHREICQLIASITSLSNNGVNLKKNRQPSLNSLQSVSISQSQTRNNLVMIQNEYDTEYYGITNHHQPQQPQMNPQTQSHYQNLGKLTFNNSLQSNKTSSFGKDILYNNNGRIASTSNNSTNEMRNSTNLQYIPPSNDFYQSTQVQMFANPDHQSHYQSTQNSQVGMANQWISFINNFEQKSESNHSKHLMSNENLDSQSKQTTVGKEKKVQSTNQTLPQTSNHNLLDLLGGNEGNCELQYSPYLPNRYNNFIPISETVSFDEEGNPYHNAPPIIHQTKKVIQNYSSSQILEDQKNNKSGAQMSESVSPKAFHLCLNKSNSSDPNLETHL